MKPQDHRLLSLTLNSTANVTDADAFVEVLAGSLKLLKEINKSFSDFGSETLAWQIVDAGHNSPLFTKLAPINLSRGKPDFGQQVIVALTNGIRHLSGSDAPPPHFNEAALSYTAALVRSFARGVAGIEFASNGDRVFVTKDVATNANAARRRLELLSGKASGEYQEYGSIEGQLKGLQEQSSRDKLEVEDSLTGDQTKCYISSPELETQVREAWKHRVSLSGQITVDKITGKPVRLDVESIRILGNRDQLPQIEDLYGINITGGIESSEYIRGLRDAD